jgi:hypothetical protein
MMPRPVRDPEVHHHVDTCADGSTFDPTADLVVRGGHAVECALGALAEPDLLYIAIAGLAVDDLTNNELGSLYCQLQELVPLQTEWQNARLCCWVLCTAPSASAAAWKVVEAVRAIPTAVLVQVEVGLPGAASPRLVLTRDAAPAAAGWQEATR